MVAKDDWRIQGQDKYLRGVTLKWKKYTKYREGWDHDHCAFCGGKFMVAGTPETIQEGYATEDNYRWICKKCFDDFKEMFEFSESKP